MRIEPLNKTGCNWSTKSNHDNKGTFVFFLFFAGRARGTQFVAICNLITSGHKHLHTGPFKPALNCFFSFSEHLSATEIGCNFVNQKCIRSYQISTKAMHITAKSNLFKRTLTASLFCIRACICIASQSDHVSRCASNCLWGIDRHSYQIHLDLTVLGIKKVFSLHLFRLISLKTWSINAPFYEYAQVPWQMWSL